MADTVITVFVEGDTEVDFYKKLIAYLREKNGGRLNCKVEVKNVKGVGNYQSKVCRIFEKSVIAKNPFAEHKVVLCYDSDVFEFSRKPRLSRNGAYGFVCDGNWVWKYRGRRIMDLDTLKMAAFDAFDKE